MLSEEVYTERVYIDPERLIKLKQDRKTLKFVPSIYEPPPEVQHTQITNYPLDSFARHSLSLQSQDQYKLQILQNSKDANIDFILSLLGEVKKEQIVQMRSGEQLDFTSPNRWLILEGEVNVLSSNASSYTKGEGYFFFLSDETKKKIKTVQCTRETKLLKIAPNIYEGYLRNYLVLKNAQKIKYLKYCPFFVWNDQLCEDLAACAEMTVHQREEVIYNSHAPSTHIYFVKEGVVLLERVEAISNNTIKDYETHYQKNEINQREVTLIVKKGMVFGIDGILLKQHDKILQNAQLSKPQHPEQPTKKSTRIYTAKTMGRTQIYSIKRQILQTLFNLSDITALHNFSRQLSKGDVQRISYDYADMVIKHPSLPKITHAVTRRNVVLESQPTSLKEKEIKRNAHKIRIHEQNVRKQSIANIIADRKIKSPPPQTPQQINESLINQLNHKLNLLDRNPQDSKLFAFPKLTSNRKLRISATRQTSQKHIFNLLKDNKPNYKSTDKSQIKLTRRPSPPSKTEKLCLIKVRSYRTLISSLL